MFDTKYDIIVVGAGHAGCEAAAIGAKRGCKVLLITMNMGTIGQMSCNPAMGGVAKGQLVREIDALGGLSGVVTDRTMIQFRMLNRSKGPAMWSPRAQSDRVAFSAEWRRVLEDQPNIHFWQDMVTSLIINNNEVGGVVTGMGIKFSSKSVILTNGTFLNGLIHVGEKNFTGGRTGEPAAKGITEQLQSLGFISGRMKTGTPPRLDSRSLNYEAFEIQPGDEIPDKFSFTDTPYLENQIPCHITYTNEKVHGILENGFKESPLFNGRIQGLGPRYCPSIEDKIVRFSDKDRHQLFIEPEGRNTVEVYLNGFSSSLPETIQDKALRQIPGFENMRMFRPGYAIEYDYFPPTQLSPTLETHLIKGLFFAGQINGTTGYEEAAAQGLMAGLNASAKVYEEAPIILRRDEAYIGVLIDDLVHKGTDEPYRMFTSRAEYRILLRQDNADQRLSPLAYKLNTIDSTLFDKLQLKLNHIDQLKKLMFDFSVEPNEINNLLESKGSQPLSQKVKAIKIVTRPHLSFTEIINHIPELQERTKFASQNEILQAEIELKYAGYIQKEKEMASKIERLEGINIPNNFNFHKINALSSEAKEKLTKLMPATIGHASRISGVSPADISVLLVYMGR